MSYIKNRGRLLSHGNIRLRRAALDIIDHALSRADPYKATRNLVRIDGSRLTVADLCFDLNEDQRVFLLGAGKATFPIAKALEELLGDRITDGVVICKSGQHGRLNYSQMNLASHPIPDEAGFAAARDALTLARKTRPGDIVFGCITGGSSALMPYPIPEISLDDKKQVNQLLLTCGANIIEINAVRKHLSQIKGGRLARRTLTKYNLWGRVPAPVARFLKGAGPQRETPKEIDLEHYRKHNFIIVAGDAACVAAEEKARELGFQAMILSTMFEGESLELGANFAAIAKEIKLNHRPLTIPAAVIGGGETTVKIYENPAGLGGPNQEFALAASLGIEDAGPVVVVGFDSDGTDGPTDVAGGIVDEQTLSRAREKGIDIFASLVRHDVTPVLKTLEDVIETGATGTNVNDLKFLLMANG
jgi:glycerate-2-kinase